MCPTHVGAPQARNTTRGGCAGEGSSGYSLGRETGKEASETVVWCFVGLREWAAGVSEGVVSRPPQGTAKQVGSGFVVSSEEQPAGLRQAGWHRVKNVY